MYKTWPRGGRGASGGMQRRISHAHGRADRLVHGRARARSLADVIRDHNDRRTAD